MKASPKHRKEESSNFWNANPCGGNWSMYKDFMDWMQRTEPYAYEIMSRHAWEDKKVLDVGCGQGTLLNYLPRFGAKIYGLDMSSESLHRAAIGARELGYDNSVYLSLADAEWLPFPDASFDVAISFGVFHHIPNPYVAVEEILRVLKPDGLALVMLYRTDNPKWWMTRLMRAVSRLVDLIQGEQYSLANRLRSEHEKDDVRGTALLELFGCPILKAFSNRQAREMFSEFSRVFISNHQPGFQRMTDIVPMLRPFEFLFAKIDRRFTQVWGFYEVIQAWK